MKGFGQLIAQRLGDRPRDAWSRIDLVERVAVPLEEPDLLEAQSQNLIVTDRLQKASQGLGVKAVGHDGQFGDRPLKPEHSKQARPAQHGQSLQRMVPESIIVSEGCKRFQKEPGLDGGILLPERYFQLLYKIAKSDRVLLILGPAPMGRLVKRETRRLLDRCQLGQ